MIAVILAVIGGAVLFGVGFLVGLCWLCYQIGKSL